MKTIICVFLISFLFACNQKSETIINENLLLFKTSFLSESDNEKYAEILKTKKLNKPEIKYLNDLIYVSYLTQVNACGEIKGNITIKNDTIFLQPFSNSEEVCTSTSLERFTFIISNYKELKYSIIIK
jgi:hypothetical protein